MLKEFHLIARAIYTIATTLLFSSMSGLTLMTTFVSVGAIIFFMSFMWQYYVIHFAMKNVVKPRNRVLFLIGWWFVTVGSICLSVYMIPTFSDLPRFDSKEDLIRTMTMWGSIFITASSAFVAMTCARRAFTRHGALG